MTFKRGDFIHVPGGNGSNVKHPAVHLGNGKAVYLDDDGAVDHVPSEAIATSEKMKKVSSHHRQLGNKYLENMKEEIDMSSIKRIISESIAENPIGLKETFAELMAERIQAALTEKVSELQELSNKTLGNYIHKASASKERIEKARNDNREQLNKVSFHDRPLKDAIGYDDEAHKIHLMRQAADDATRKHLEKQGKKLHDKAWNRDAGIYTALKKLK